TQLIEEINRMLAKKRAEEARKRAEAEQETKTENRKSRKKTAAKEFNKEVPDDSLVGKVFVSLKGKLKLPVRGELTNNFGSPREAGGVSWKGLFIRAETGQV